MGRSVSTPRDCIAIAYKTFDCELDEDCAFEWEWFLESIQEQACALWPSFYDVDEWLGNENRCILKNGHAYIGVSEYCGLVAIWLRDDYQSDTPEIAEHWCSQIAPKFLETFSDLNKIATASNGEAFFERVS